MKNSAQPPLRSRKRPRRLIPIILTAIMMVMALPCVQTNAADSFRILRLSSPTITIGGKTLKKGDVFSGDGIVVWADAKQVMEVKNERTKQIYTLSRRAMATKGNAKTLSDYYLRNTPSSTRQPKQQPKPKK